MPNPINSDNQVQVLVFKVGPHQACLPLENVIQVFDSVSYEPPPEHLTGPGLGPDFKLDPLPGVLGIINVRGQDVPLVDLRPRWNLPVKQVSLTDQLIVMRAGGTTVSIMTDQVMGTRTYPRRKIFPLRRILPGEAPHAAVAETDGIMILFDSDSLFSSETLAAFESINRSRRHERE
ncbi:MAG: chemotaxis protein CheW [Candidatus Obscuribacterales bacterium]